MFKNASQYDDFTMAEYRSLLCLAKANGYRFYSYTDLPLLEYVREPVIVNPDPRLARVARRRGWRVESW